MSRRETKTMKHRRKIRLSVVLPANVELLVGTNDADPGEDSDWEILSVSDPRCAATKSLVQENMQDADFRALAEYAAAAEDEE